MYTLHIYKYSTYVLLPLILENLFVQMDQSLLGVHVYHSVLEIHEVQVLQTTPGGRYHQRTQAVLK